MIKEAVELSESFRSGKSPVDGHGASCQFLRLNDKWGVKLYTTKSKRNLAFERQTAAAEYELAPSTAGTFDLPANPESGSFDFRFGYITELVDELLIDSELVSHLDDLDAHYQDDIDDITRELRENLYDTIDWNFFDNHDENVGFLNGKMVCIDFV